MNAEFDRIFPFCKYLLGARLCNVKNSSLIVVNYCGHDSIVKNFLISDSGLEMSALSQI